MIGTTNIKLDNLAMLLWSCSKSCLRFVCFSRSQTWAICGEKLRLKIKIKFRKIKWNYASVGYKPGRGTMKTEKKKIIKKSLFCLFDTALHWFN